jgi:osmoprotectant transport system substrate-binding protein
MRNRSLSFAALAVAGALALAACSSNSTGSSSSAAASSGGASKTVTVASFNFPESVLLADLYAGVLKKAGFNVIVRPNLGAREIVEPALQKGSAGGGVDLVPEYLSTFTEFLNNKVNGANAAPKASSNVASTLAAGNALAGPLNIVLLNPSSATDENAFAVTKSFATTNHLTKLSDLAAYKGNLVLGGPAECPQRPYCEPGLTKTYGIKFTSFTALDAGGPLTKKALQQGKIQIGLVFSSDPGITVYGLTVLTDDKGLQNVDAIVPAVNKSVDSATLDRALNGLSSVLTTSDLLQLNAAVQLQGVNPEQVAQGYLSAKGLG